MGTSWLTTVKKVFRSPSKTSPKKNHKKRRDESRREDEEEEQKARRALSALKGIVKLQALVRGHNIRKQAKTTLKCMQTLIWVQAKLRDQSLPRPSLGQTRKSMYAESNNLFDKYKDIHHRKPMFQDDNNIGDQYKCYLYTIEDIEAILQAKREASLYHEQAFAYALSQQHSRTDVSHPHGSERYEDLIEKYIQKKKTKDESEWLGQWLESKEYDQFDNRGTTNRIEPIKDIEMESLQSQLKTPSNLRLSHQNQAPPSRRHSLHSQPMSPTPRLIQAQSESPQCSKGYRSHSVASTPSLRHRPIGLTVTTPNYMAATESAKAKARTHSTPRQRQSAATDRSEWSSSVKKRLSFPVPNEGKCYQGRVYNDYSQKLRSPSFRSVQEGLYCVERGTSCCSCTDITGGEISPASTSHFRRWLS